MITGFNTNVRHLGRTFHVQTEDSGRDHPHIISHVYCGGTILASEKQEYGELLEEQDLTVRVRSLMENQHKALIIRLQSGELDGVIAERLELDSPETTGSATAKGVEVADVAPPSTSRPGPGTPGPGVSEPEISDPAAAPGFGADVGAEKPLDEVILEYLVDKARKRPARRAKIGKAAGPASRSKG